MSRGLGARGIAILLMCVASALVSVGGMLLAVHSHVRGLYGPPSGRLGPVAGVEYSFRLWWHDGLLTTKKPPDQPTSSFSIAEGQSISELARQLEEQNLIVSSSAFMDYLVYKGMDTTIEAGDHDLSASMSIVEVAEQLQDATPGDVDFVVLAGWRREEIAAALLTSGLEFTPEQFLAVSQTLAADREFLPPNATSLEGFLFPDVYNFPRGTPPEDFVDALADNFALHLTDTLRQGFAAHGLDVYQAVTLASIVERESVHDAEQPLIASVFLNRLGLHMKLDSDATVQYALGNGLVPRTWWKSPLSAADLQFGSPFNTYLHAGLPPAPIANPGASALAAVAAPVDSPYLYFRARCDGSGYHAFAETFEAHLANACP